MRIIAGKAKSIRLKTPKQSRGVRPLTDQARGALFNILGDKTAGSRFLDVFAGTGAVGIEALSRGAKIAFFVEISRPVVELLRRNLEITGFRDQAEVYAVEVMRALNIFAGKQARFDIVFMGAPYDSPVLEKALKKMSETEILKPEGVLIAEHRKQHRLQEEYGKLKVLRETRYGETVLSFYSFGHSCPD